MRKTPAVLPSPEELGKVENLEVMMTFRLSRSDADALQALAQRGGVGRATFCRRIMEEYIHMHAKKPRRK